MGDTNHTIQNALEIEYPLLDSSLLAAFVSDLPAGVDPAHESFKGLHQTLSQLSLDAQRTIDTSVLDSSHHSARGYNERLASGENGLCLGTPDDASQSASGESSTSTGATSVISCTSPLGFLQILFPQLPRTLLSQALHECSDPEALSDEPDLSTILDRLLTLEYIQDLTERGLQNEGESNSNEWQLARGKYGSRSKAKSRVHKYTISLGHRDITQRNHTSGIPTPASSMSSADPWTRLTSLATRLSELLHPTPPNFFMSHFHTPAALAHNGKSRWKSEGDALRKALSILASRTNTHIDEAAVDIVCDVVFEPETMEVLQLNLEKRIGLASDARLCLAAAQGSSDTAVDLMLVLLELDCAFIQGDGVAHAVEPIKPSSISHTTSNVRSLLHTGVTAVAKPNYPPPVPPPPLSQKHPPRAPQAHIDHGWTLVKPRRPASKTLVYPHADFIPVSASYAPPMRRSLDGPKNRSELGRKDKVGEADLPDAAWYKARADEAQSKRKEALHEATHHWHGGNSKSRGGEVAFYYAEKARDLQEQRNRWALHAARVMVREKQTTMGELDLHGLTVAEARVIVTEVLAATPPNLRIPLKIITGRGHHSAGRVGVLGPAMREMLRAAGWRVNPCDGGLLVRGRTNITE